jgi:putative Holliday junction resolvase
VAKPGTPDQAGALTAAVGTDTALVFDYGRRRIGVAIASRVSGTASGIAVLAAKDGQPDWQALDTLVAEWGPDVLVSGLPYNADGSESDMTAEVRHFVALLAERYALDVETVDERLTSAEAEEMLRNQRQSGLRRRRLRKEDVDRAAAVLIGQSWLREGANRHHQSHDRD